MLRYMRACKILLRELSRLITLDFVFRQFVCHWQQLPLTTYLVPVRLQLIHLAFAGAFMRGSDGKMLKIIIAGCSIAILSILAYQLNRLDEKVQESTKAQVVYEFTGEVD